MCIRDRGILDLAVKLFVNVQKDAIENGIEKITLDPVSYTHPIKNNITIIKGKAGTVKTTIVKAIIKLYKKLNKSGKINIVSFTCLLYTSLWQL